jgi:hypothetical protein
MLKALNTLLYVKLLIKYYYLVKTRLPNNIELISVRYCYRILNPIIAAIDNYVIA